MNSRTRATARTALFVALLVAVQYVTKPLGQFVTGSLVNFILIAAALLVGLGPGIFVAVISPFLAFLIGIGPAFVQIIPVVALGNIVIVLVYALILGNAEKPGTARWIVALAVGAALKCAVLWFGIVKIALPLVPGINEKQAAVLSATFSWPQLVTALIGGLVALLVIPRLKKAIKN